MKRINLEHDDYGSFAKKQLATLRVKLASAGNNGDLEPVVIDAHALAFAGTSFLGVVAEVDLELQSHGQRLLVVGAAASIREMFRVAGLERLLA